MLIVTLAAGRALLEPLVLLACRDLLDLLALRAALDLRESEDNRYCLKFFL